LTFVFISHGKSERRKCGAQAHRKQRTNILYVHKTTTYNIVLRVQEIAQDERRKKLSL